MKDIIKCLISYFMKLEDVYIVSACFNHMHVHVIRYYINVADIPVSQLNSKTLKLESLKKKPPVCITLSKNMMFL